VAFLFLSPRSELLILVTISLERQAQRKMRAWQFPGRPPLALADCRTGGLLTSQCVEHVGVNHHKGKVAPLPPLYFTISPNKM